MRRLSYMAVGQPPGCLVQPFGPRVSLRSDGTDGLSVEGPSVSQLTEFRQSDPSTAVAEGKDGEACLSELQSDSVTSKEDVSGKASMPDRYSSGHLTRLFPGASKSS